MSKYKILFAVNAMNMGGIENFVMNIVRNIDTARFEVEFLYCDNRECFFDEEISSLGFKVTKIISRRANLLKHLSNLKHFFKANTFDAVHINYDSAVCVTVARAAKKAGIKNIVIHSHNSSASKPFMHKIFKPFVAKYANKYFACSLSAAEWMFSKKAIRAEKVKIIKNAIDTSKYRYNHQFREQIRKEFGIAENKIVLGHIGRFNYVKNHKFLIDVFYEYHKLNANSNLLLVGTGELLEEVKSYVNSKGLNNSVIFAGVRTDISKILSAMDCFVMPSLFEGLPVTLVESQAAGLTVLASDTITKEVELSNLVEYYSLDNNARAWADKIKIAEGNREEYNDIIKKSGFDIEEELINLEKYYKE